MLKNTFRLLQIMNFKIACASTFRRAAAGLGILCAAAALSACTGQTMPEVCHDGNVVLNISIPGMRCRANNPDEDLVSNLAVYVFDSSTGQLEESRYYDSRDMESGASYNAVSLRLLRNKKYDFYVCANLGYKPQISSREEAENFRYHLNYPDDYTRGMPMSAVVKGVAPDISGSGVSAGQTAAGSGGRVDIELERCMARIDLLVDRSRLDREVSFRVESVRIGACPKSAALFSVSRAESRDDLFDPGFTRGSDECYALNSSSPSGESGSISVYMLENLQGTSLNALCSYIEIEASYNSGTYYTSPEGRLRYRFYLGDSRKDFNVERNCRYRVTVIPYGDGLGGGTGSSGSDGRGEAEWRIEKSDLKKYVERISLDRSTLDFSYAGEERYLSASVSPADAGNSALEWFSSNNSVAVVDRSGKVTAVSDGNCTVSCSATDGSGVSAGCSVDVSIKKAWVRFYPQQYMEPEIGDRVRIWSEYFPPNMSCRIDRDDLEYDCSRGIYDYELSEDGSSAVLTIRGEGSGMFRFEVGPPLDTSALFYIHVKPLK